jgi:hypothetical protein
MDGLPTPDVGGSELAKMASVPLVTKLAAGVAAVGVAGGTVAASGTHAGNDHVAVAPAEPGTAPMTHRTGSPAQTARAETHPVSWAGRTPRPSRNAVQRPSVAAGPSTNGSAGETSPSVQVPAGKQAPKPVGDPRAPAPTAPRQTGLPSTPDPSGATGSSASGAGSVPVPADPGPAGGTDDGTDDGTAQPVDTGDPANAAGGGTSTDESVSGDDSSSASGEADSRDDEGSDDSGIDDDKSGDCGDGGDDHHDAAS